VNQRNALPCVLTSAGLFIGLLGGALAANRYLTFHWRTQLGLETILPWASAAFLTLAGVLFATAAYRLSQPPPSTELNARAGVARLARFVLVVSATAAGVSLGPELSQQANNYMMELYLALTVELLPDRVTIGSRYFWCTALALFGYHIGWRTPSAAALIGVVLAYQAAWPASNLVVRLFRPYALYPEQIVTLSAYSRWTFIFLFGALLAIAGHRLGRLVEPRLRAAGA
jgi:hypothetical protein